MGGHAVPLTLFYSCPRDFDWNLRCVLKCAHGKIKIFNQSHTDHTVKMYFTKSAVSMKGNSKKNMCNAVFFRKRN